MLREYDGREIELNDEGFLLDSEQWTPGVAAGIAALRGTALEAVAEATTANFFRLFRHAGPAAR